MTPQSPRTTSGEPDPDFHSLAEVLLTVVARSTLENPHSAAQNCFSVRPLPRHRVCQTLPTPGVAITQLARSNGAA